MADDTDVALRAIGSAVEAALVENHRDFLRFLVRRVGDADTAADVLQQFCLRAVSRGSELRRSESAVAWLYRLLRTTLVDHYRSETKRRRREADYAQMEILSNEGPDVELQGKVCACLETLLPTLKAEYADILQRVDLRETPPREVARDLGLTPNNVRVRLHRARQAIKESLLLSCRTCAEHGCLDCDCKAPGGSSGGAEEAAGKSS
ncbi:MAG: sigma-70 family RNA polymerase sigma factor [Gammaproteobacteria bacterium]|nr:MAG: sigma-70 family RNA polymerase sigma factor [Gammaproteobacteria bacterium]